MANRYGKGDNVERFDSSAGRWQQGMGRYEEMLRKEQAVTEATRTTAGFESQATRAAQQGARARAESADLAERQAQAAERSAKAARLEAEAVRETAQARELARPLVAPTGRRPVDVFRGATDPLINQAYGIGAQVGGIPTQYAIRQGIQGIGSYRARDLRAALEAGSAPAGQTPLNVRQAQIGVVESEVSLAEANKRLASLRRTGGTRGDIAEALSAQELAQANVAAAKARVDQERQAAEAHQANVAAIQRETEARTAAAESAAKAAARGDIITHPQLFGRQAYAPISQPRVYGDVQEVNPFASGTPGRSISQAEQIAARAAQVQAANLAATTQTASFATTAMGEFEAREVSVAAATQRAAVIQRLYSDEMHRHGALTAEFIQATARGEVTLREFGNEMLVTIGKFAGWTAAATAVYGAFRVISDIKTGAVAAQSAVEGLTRFIPALDRPRAYQGVLGLSRQTNVGVQDVGDVAQIFARRYNNPQTGLADTLTATRTALLAYKLDQISTADSTRYLMAITQEWQINAQRLPGIFDQISAAQRKFGARVSETLPALARSSSAVKNAGGDINQLIGLLALTQVRTGQTGNTVGTAFLRSASNFFRSPKSVAVERGFGLDPEEGYTQFLIDAVKRAQTLNGPDRTALAKAIGGPQYGGRIFQSLLNAGPAQVARTIGGTSPDATRGSAQQELQHVLNQTDQQLQQIGHTLQRIGGYLAESGLLSFAGVALHGVNDLLGGLEQLLRFFNELPGPVKETLALVTELAVTMRLLSRFGISQRLQQIPIAGAFVQPGARLRQQALTDQNAVVAAQRRQLESDSVNAANVRRAQQRSLDRARPAVVAATTELEAGVADPRRRAYLQQYLVGLELQARAAEDAARLAEADVEVSRQRLATDEANLAEIKAANARNIEALLAQRQLLVSPMRGAVPAGEVPVPITGRQFLNQTEERGALVNNTPLAERTVSRFGLAATPYLAGLALTGRSGERIAATADHMIEGTGRAITSVQRTGQSMSRFGSRIAAFGAALGPLDYALIGIPALLEVVNLMNKAGDDAGKALDQLDRLQQPGSQDQLRQNLRTAQARADKAPSYLQRLAGADPLHPSILGPILDATAFIDRHTFAPNAQSPAEIYRQQQAAAQQSADELQRVRQLQQRDRARGGPHGVSNRFASDIIRDINNSANAAKAGVSSQADVNAALVRYRSEIQTAYDATPKNVELMREALNLLAGASKNIGDYAATLKTLDDKGLTNAISAVAEELGQFGPATSEGKADLQKLRVAYRVATDRWKAAGSAPNAKALAQNRATLFQAITAAVQSEVQDGLEFANTEAERTKAYADANRLLTDQLTTVRRTKTTTQLRRGGGTVTTYGDPHRAPLDDAAKQSLREQRAQLRDQQYQDQETGRQIQLALTQSRSADQVRNSRLAVDSARAQVEAARTRYGRESRQYAQALTALNQARQQQAAALLAQIQAEGELAQARVGNDPAAQARAAVTAARKALAYMQAHAKDFDPTAILQAEATLANAENQRSDQVRQDALDLTQLRGEIVVARLHGDPVAQARAAIGFAREERAKARNTKERLQATLDLLTANNDLQDALTQREQDRFAYLESLTTDPVKQAGLEVQKAAVALSNTHPGTDAYYQAQAQYHQALQQQHAARLSSQEDDIDFQLQMEKITRDEAIKRYEQLAKMHNLSKQERRDLLLKIHQLQKDEENDANGFGLRVGNVKLPTVYDVRRAIAEGRRGNQGTNVNVNNRVTMSVNVTDGGDVAGVFEELDRQIGTSATSGMRAAGLTV